MKEVHSPDEAVSPIIATILLIGITVVLAATLIVILHSFTNSSHIEEVSSAQYMAGPFNSTSPQGKLYYFNISSTSVQVPLGQIHVVIFNGTTLIFTGTLATSSNANVTVSPTSPDFSAGNSVMIILTGKEKIITTMSLIYASSVFATVSPT
ncbi:MAG: type IV pilin [Candidatus Thermoplasmatota archaeon]|jgi:flagellin-like protein|nr:type IV pilin [Candidatus Thermoplasmatota archaeon]MCL5988103.1 type IV pilin [Candidatus Thermoplasmatota archaeon]